MNRTVPLWDGIIFLNKVINMNWKARYDKQLRVGDKVYGVDDGPYCHTVKGNGYGIITEINDELIDINWFKRYNSVENFSVEPAYFRKVLE